MDKAGLDCLPRLFPLKPFSQKHFEQRLVGNVALVGQYLQIFNHGYRQPHGDGAQRGLEFHKLHTRGL